MGIVVHHFFNFEDEPVLFQPHTDVDIQCNGIGAICFFPGECRIVGVFYVTPGKFSVGVNVYFFVHKVGIEVFQPVKAAHPVYHGTAPAVFV